MSTHTHTHACTHGRTHARARVQVQTYRVVFCRFWHELNSYREKRSSCVRVEES